MLQTPDVVSLNMDWAVLCSEKSFRIFRIFYALPVTFSYF